MSQSGSARRATSNPSSTSSPNREGLLSVSTATTPTLSSAPPPPPPPYGRDDDPAFAQGDLPLREMGRLPLSPVEERPLPPQQQQHARPPTGVRSILNPAEARLAETGNPTTAAAEATTPSQEQSPDQRYGFGATPRHPSGPPPPIPSNLTHRLPERASPTSSNPLPALNNPRHMLSPRAPSRSSSVNLAALRSQEPSHRAVSTFATRTTTGKRSLDSDSPTSTESPSVRLLLTYAPPLQPPPHGGGGGGGGGGFPGASSATARPVGPPPATIAARPGGQHFQQHRSLSQPGFLYLRDPGGPSSQDPSLPSSSQQPIKQEGGGAGGLQQQLEGGMPGPYQPHGWFPPQPMVPWGQAPGLGDMPPQPSHPTQDMTMVTRATRGGGRGRGRGGGRAGVYSQQHPNLFMNTEDGRVAVPIDLNIASRAADQKRQRNAGASQRFRQRRKHEREEERAQLERYSKVVETLEGQVRDLSRHRDYYRNEKHRLASAVRQNPAMARLADGGPPSPPPLDLSVPSLLLEPDLSQGGAQDGPGGGGSGGRIGSQGYDSNSSNEQRPARRQRTGSTPRPDMRSASAPFVPRPSEHFQHSHGQPTHQHHHQQRHHHPGGTPQLPPMPRQHQQQQQQQRMTLPPLQTPPPPLPTHHQQQQYGGPASTPPAPPRPTSASSMGGTERLPPLRSLESPASEASSNPSSNLALAHGAGAERSAAAGQGQGQDRRDSGHQYSTYRASYESGWASQGGHPPPPPPPEGGPR